MEAKFHSRSMLPFGTLLLSLLFIAGIVLPLQNPPSMDDGMRHLTMARILQEQGLRDVPGWSGFFTAGMLKEIPADPWYLADVLLIPLAELDTVTALKIIILLSALLIGCGMLLLFRHVRISPMESTVLLLLLFFGEVHFLGRLLLARPFSLMTALSLFVLWAIFERRWIILGILLGLSALFSQLFVFPLAMTGIASLVLYLHNERRAAIAMAAAAGIGTCIGILLHPAPLLYLQYLATVFMMIPFLGEIGLGSEMSGGFSGPSATVLLLVAAFLLSVFCTVKERRQLTCEQATVMLLVLFLSAAFLFWIRAVDLLWPLLILLCAELLSGSPGCLRRAKDCFGAGQIRLLTSLFALVLISDACYVLLLVHQRWEGDSQHSLAVYATELAPIPPDALILNPDWDYFPPYITVRPDLKYATGIDATFTYLASGTASTLLQMLHSDAFRYPRPLVDADIWLQEIVKEMPSDYLVLVRERYEPFIDVLDRSELLENVSVTGTGRVVVYRIADVNE